MLLSPVPGLGKTKPAPTTRRDAVCPECGSRAATISVRNPARRVDDSNYTPYKKIGRACSSCPWRELTEPPVSGTCSHKETELVQFRGPRPKQHWIDYATRCKTCKRFL